MLLFCNRLTVNRLQNNSSVFIDLRCRARGSRAGEAGSKNHSSSDFGHYIVGQCFHHYEEHNHIYYIFSTIKTQPKCKTHNDKVFRGLV